MIRAHLACLCISREISRERGSPAKLYYGPCDVAACALSEGKGTSAAQPSSKQQSNTMAANMMTKQALFVASPTACFRSQANSKPVKGRSSLKVRAQPPQTAPDKTVTPDEILACECSSLLRWPHPVPVVQLACRAYCRHMGWRATRRWNPPILLCDVQPPAIAEVDLPGACGTR